MEVRIKGLDSELSEVKTSQDPSNREVEEYEQDDMEEFALRISLESKLHT